jgi:hypothetical protein
MVRSEALEALPICTTIYLCTLAVLAAGLPPCPTCQATLHMITALPTRKSKQPDVSRPSIPCAELRLDATITSYTLCSQLTAMAVAHAPEVVQPAIWFTLSQ